MSDERKIQLITTSQELAKKYKEPLNSKYAILLGNPAFGIKLGNAADIAESNRSMIFSIERGSQLVPLPGTEKEVLGFEKILKDNDWRTHTIMNEEATETQLKEMIKPNILHIATHGFFQSDIEEELTYSNNPMFKSGLLLSGSEKIFEGNEDFRTDLNSELENGILTAQVDMNLNVDNTNLVVLSACETGLGEIRNGEGIYGLPRAFMSAGAHSIIMSLWKVNDETTQQMMTLFYANWFSGQSKREVLQNAKLELRKNYPHPYYWGAFILVGE